MHSDESRPTHRQQQLLDEAQLAAPEKLLQQVKELRQAEKRNVELRRQVGKLQKDLKASQSTLKTTSNSLKNAETAHKNAKATLGSTTSALEASRKEIRRLKDDLARVRGSRSMRLGKALLSPIQLLKGRPKAPTPAVAPPPPAEEPQPVISLPEPMPAEEEKPLSAYTLEELQERFTENPTAEHLAPLMSRLWFNHGEVTRTAQLLREHEELMAELPAASQRTAARILGTERLIQAGVSLPERSRGAAYVAEPHRILYCVHSTPVFNSNGYSTRTHGVAKGLADAGHDVTVVARAGYPWDSKVNVAKPKEQRTSRPLDGIAYVHHPGANLNTTPLDHYLQVATDAYVREARLTRPSIIQAASNHLTALPALIAARRLGIPFVYEVRGLWEITESSGKEGWEESERYKLAVELESLVAREADAVLAITEELAGVLRERGVDPSKISVAPNAVDTSAFVPLPRDAAYAAAKRIRTDVPVIGFAGSIVDYEGLDTLLDASGILDERGIDHHVVIAGSGAAFEGLKGRRDAEGLGHVTFLGRLPIEEMPRLLSTFDIMPCPRRSLPVTELVSPLKPLEAFGAGKAVVLSDLSPHRTLAGTDMERALLVPAEDPTALADSLERLITDRDLRADLGRAARLWAIDERSWVIVADAMVDAHAGAVRRHEESAPQSSRRLADLTVGIIADEFTTATLSPSMNLIPIDRENWRHQLDQEPFDFVFVESAWKGNGGQWHRGVGKYAPEEHADVMGLLTDCKERGIPTVFWNKEDPVHFARFRETAAACDHVFTTDANMIVPYLETIGGTLKTASSMPFYAQPAIHNPLRTKEFDPTVAYAGTFYGQRYADRSEQLEGLLNAALPTGLTIYDRQLGVPDSPYHFPTKYLPHVRGVLPYDEVVESYRTHLAHINVNSVTDSPTMFSRRVVEVAACGGLVMSGPGRGIPETLGPTVASSSNPEVWAAYFHAWANRPHERLREAWLQMRTVMRSHTIDTAFAIIARTVGIPVVAKLLPGYGVAIDTNEAEAVESLLAQSVPPAVAYITGDSASAIQQLEGCGIRIAGRDATQGQPEWFTAWHGDHPRTYSEDLLTATRFGDFTRISAREAFDEDFGGPLATVAEHDSNPQGFVRGPGISTREDLDQPLALHHDNTLVWLVPPPEVQEESVVVDTVTSEGAQKTVLVAGHDLKFAQGIIASLEGAGHRVLIDKWDNHTQHDEEQSLALLAEADVVLCEWGLGNLVWYSKNVSSQQRLVVRVHSQELFRPYLSKATHASVDRYLFVGELIRQAAVASHGVPAHKTAVVPNYVDVDALWQPKLPGAEFNLGLVGIVPRSKRLDLAIDVLEKLLDQDSRYRLFIKGAQPSDYPWMADRPDEMAWYDEQYERIRQINERWPDAVVFDGFGADMHEWYRKIGIALSVSDFESFHFTIADGAASGALPVALAWPGADQIYPRPWLAATTGEMAQRIRSERPDGPALSSMIADAFAAEQVLRTIKREVLGE